MVAGVFVVACAPDDGDPRETEALVATGRAGAWTSVSEADDDPFFARRPDAVACSLSGWFIEDDGTEVDTATCNYLTLRQSSLVDLRRRDALRVVFFHFDLTAAEPAEGYAALAVGDTVVWSYTAQIPKPAGYFDELVELEELDLPNAPPGTPVYFHIDNHGQNTWRLQSVDRVP